MFLTSTKWASYVVEETTNENKQKHAYPIQLSWTDRLVAGESPEMGLFWADRLVFSLG